MMLVMNSHHDLMTLTPSESQSGSEWVRLVETDLGDAAWQAACACGARCDVTGRSLLAFMLEPEAT
jgi:isoamylase